ncbi:hypothetical protein EUA93_10750 [Nocardioides oleivorans]|uniref:Lipoprotein n=1 Tax=Nocardioides oleivorans TaxID=273676 RepID=A0A4Q2S312_9ACTN|nr:hypothetical protein [Nocardioides oleivorans]RYB94784.1 hypothetical protein EUA93_10750 [Nocardioides oleivorans]
MHVRRALALAVLAPLLLVGCSDDPEPKPQMPETSTATPTEEPTETETPEVESAEDFIRRWVKAGDEMQVTGDTAEYDAMTPNCKACQGFVESVEQVYAAGGSAQFAGTTVTKIRRYAAKPPTYDVSQDVAETVIKHGDTGKTETYPAGSTRIRVILKTTQSGWLVTYFGIL